MHISAVHVPYTIYSLYVSEGTPPQQRHGNTAVESVVSPSQSICRGGHKDLGYLTAKSNEKKVRGNRFVLQFLRL